MSFDLLIKQFASETEGWQRMVGFWQQENAFFKVRLSELVTNNGDDMVPTAERFNEDFLSQDQMIGYLAYELKRQAALLKKQVQDGSNIFFEIKRNQKKLRTEMSKAEEIFSRVNEAFSEYLATLV